MILDGHIHTVGGHCDSPQEFLEKSRSIGVTGGNIFNVYPAQYRSCPGWDQRWQARIEWILSYTSQTPGFLPFHFLDPTEPDALTQVSYGKAHGIRGFKIICDHFDIADHLDVVRGIAETGLPVMFHCGILGNGTISSQWNRPLNFECLFTIPKLRFSLAHLGWPWCDELIGIYGKFELARANSAGERAEMYLDITPGTPGVYRAEALRKVYGTGYPVCHKVFWGSDLNVNNYETDCGRWWLEHDRKIFTEVEEDLVSGKITMWNPPPLRELRRHALSEVCRQFTGEP